MGRPKLGNVLFARRVPKDKIPALLAALKEGRVSAATPEGDNGLKGKETAKEDPWDGIQLMGSGGIAERGKPAIELDFWAEKQRSQIKALLDDVDRLTNEKAALEEKVQEVARMSESELVQAWIRKYDGLKATMSKGEFDQS